MAPEVLALQDPWRLALLCDCNRSLTQVSSRLSTSAAAEVAVGAKTPLLLYCLLSAAAVLLRCISSPVNRAKVCSALRGPE